MTSGTGSEGPRDQPPAAGLWRTDGLGGSRHSRLVDSLQQPADDADPERAARLCGEVSRKALQDLAPVMLLLPAPERSRVQVLLSYTVALFDFALQPGVEGERLAALNRWEFDREVAFDGTPPGQPIFVALAAEHRRRPFADAAFDSLASLARQVAVRPRPQTRRRTEWRWRELGQAFASGLFSADAAAEPDDLTGLGELLGATVRLRRLQDLLLDRSLVHSQVPLDEWPAASIEAPTTDQIGQLAAAECRRLRQLFTDLSPALIAQPGPYSRAVLFLSLADQHLLDRFTGRGEQAGAAPPRIGLPARMMLLARALRPF